MVYQVQKIIDIPISDGFTRRLVTGVLLLFWSILSVSQPQVKITPDVVFGHKAGMALTFDVFQPADSINGAGIIHVISGSWVSRYDEPDTVAWHYSSFLEKGYTVFALRHSSNPQFKLPEAVNDVFGGAWFIHDHAKEYNLDSNRLGIYGGSSGGQLALMAALSGERHPVSAVVAFFPPTELNNVPDMLKVFVPALDFDSAMAAGVSPVNFASPDDPPALLICGDRDFVVRPWHSQNMFDSLQHYNVVSKLVMYEGMGHGNRYGAKGEFYEEANREMMDWFDKYLLQ